MNFKFFNLNTKNYFLKFGLLQTSHHSKKLFFKLNWNKIKCFEIFLKFYLNKKKIECIIDLRHNVALLGNTNNANNVLVTSSDTSNPVKIVTSANERKLLVLHDSTFRSITEQIKNVLTNLQAFIASDVSFSAKVHFNEPFCKDYVRESLLIPYLKHIASVAKEFSDGSHDPVPYPLLLILTRLCLEFESVSIDYLLTLADEQFFIR